MILVTSRCNNAGPFAKPIPTRSFSTAVAEFVASILRW